MSVSYQIKLEKPAEKFIRKQPKPQQERLLKAIHKLPNEGDRKSIAGTPGLFRLSVGDYRVLYTVDNGQLVVCVVDAGSRGQIYNGY